jgi:hypothetical protein
METDTGMQEITALNDSSIRPLPAARPHGTCASSSPRKLPLPGNASYLTCNSVWAELPKAQRGLDPPQQGHHIQVLDPPPVDDTQMMH